MIYLAMSKTVYVDGSCGRVYYEGGMRWFHFYCYVKESMHCGKIDFSRSLPLAGVDRIFPSLRMRPEGISHISLVLLESRCRKDDKTKARYYI